MSDTQPFWAVFVNKSRHIPGDERSRQCPGHGYPAHTERYTEIVEFATEDELRQWVEHEEALVFGKSSYRAVKCLPITVRSTISIQVNLHDSQSETVQG